MPQEAPEELKGLEGIMEDLIEKELLNACLAHAVDRFARETGRIDF
jgi:hypothetical protein